MSQVRRGFVLGAGVSGGIYTFARTLDRVESDRLTRGVITNGLYMAEPTIVSLAYWAGAAAVAKW